MSYLVCVFFVIQRNIVTKDLEYIHVGVLEIFRLWLNNTSSSLRSSE